MGKCKGEKVEGGGRDKMTFIFAACGEKTGSGETSGKDSPFPPPSTADLDTRHASYFRTV